MSIVNVRKFLKNNNMEDKIIEFNESSATVMEAAERLNCKPAHIAKSLSFLVNNKPIIIVTAGDARVDNAKFKSFFEVKANMIKAENVEDLIGHAVGGVCPFAVKEDVVVYLDESLKRFKYVYPACGSSNSAIKLTIEELETLSNYKKWIDVCKVI